MSFYYCGVNSFVRLEKKSENKLVLIFEYVHTINDFLRNKFEVLYYDHLKYITLHISREIHFMEKTKGKKYFQFLKQINIRQRKKLSFETFFDSDSSQGVIPVDLLKWGYPVYFERKFTLL